MQTGHATNEENPVELSIVVPAYNEEDSLSLFYNSLRDNLDHSSISSWELIVVDDGSIDGTLNELRLLSNSDPRVTWFSFSRNFGKEGALLCGLRHACGELVVVMDADLQDPPELLPQMVELIAGGDWDIVGTRRVDRTGEPPIRSWFARQFYRIMAKLSDAEMVDGARDFQMMRKQVVDAILEMSEYNRFSKGIFGWVGFRKTWLEYENRERVAGETKWNFWGLTAYAIDGIVAFSTAPLIISSIVGLLFSVAALLMMLVLFFRAIVFGDPVAGWPSLMCVILLVGGANLLCVGILGQYLAKTYMECKGRPNYIVRETSSDYIHP